MEMIMLVASVMSGVFFVGTVTCVYLMAKEIVDQEETMEVIKRYSVGFVLCCAGSLFMLYFVVGGVLK